VALASSAVMTCLAGQPLETTPGLTSANAKLLPTPCAPALHLAFLQQNLLHTAFIHPMCTPVHMTVAIDTWLGWVPRTRAVYMALAFCSSQTTTACSRHHGLANVPMAYSLFAEVCSLQGGDALYACTRSKSYRSSSPCSECLSKPVQRRFKTTVHEGRREGLICRSCEVECTSRVFDLVLRSGSCSQGGNHAAPAVQCVCDTVQSMKWLLTACHSMQLSPLISFILALPLYNPYKHSNATVVTDIATDIHS
jgi:hypothetical protein